MSAPAPESKCRICGQGMQTGTVYMPDPLLPGGIPAQHQLCSHCALTALERRVGQKWIVVAARRTPMVPVPDDPLDLSLWGMPAPPGDDWPQFPRERWASYPAKRTTCLLLVERMLDFQDMTDEQWVTLCMVMQYGGKTRLT